MIKKSGKFVKHDDGRIGVVYNKHRHLWKKDKVIVQFFEDGVVSEEKTLVEVKKLTITGYVD